MTATADELWDWLLACVTCGKPHTFRPSSVCDHGCQHGGSWADPDDGHPYRRRGTSDLHTLRAEWDREWVRREAS